MVKPLSIDLGLGKRRVDRDVGHQRDGSRRELREHLDADHGLVGRAGDVEVAAHLGGGLGQLHGVARLGALA
jgi:hypothetical protein